MHFEARDHGSPVLRSDETGWKLGRVLPWLHGAASEDTVLYRIDCCRGHQVLAEWIGPDEAGARIHDVRGSDGPFGAGAAPAVFGTAYSLGSDPAW